MIEGSPWRAEAREEGILSKEVTFSISKAMQKFFLSITSDSLSFTKFM